MQLFVREMSFSKHFKNWYENTARHNMKHKFIAHNSLLFVEVLRFTHHIACFHS